MKMNKRIQGVQGSSGQVKVIEIKPLNPRTLESSNPIQGTLEHLHQP